MTSNANDPSDPTTQTARILVAEDSPLNLQVALAQLRKLGYRADFAVDGKGVLEATQRSDYDIILMDCRMPQMDGYEATWQIREREKELARDQHHGPRLYIIAMTAKTREEERNRCLQAGMDDYIQKPVELPALEAALHRGLADRASQKALDEVIDPVVIAGLRQLALPGKSAPLVALIDLFLEEAPAQIQAMEAAVADNDDTSLVRLFGASTSLKGGAGNLGARSLAALCDEIEQTARNWSLADVSPLLEQTRDEFDRARAALQKIQAESSTS